MKNKAMPQNQPSWEKLHESGYQCQLMGQWDEAKHYYQQALGQKPDYAQAKLALAQLAMMESGFREGRDLYEARFATRETEGGFDWRALPLTRWRGENIAGKYLHLWVEQGFGDVIMYAGFLPWVLAQKPSRVTISMFPKMMTLFARSFPQVTVESLYDIGQYALAPLVEAFPTILKMAGQAAVPVDLEPMRRDYERAVERGMPDFIAPMGDLMVYGLPGFVPSAHQKPYLTPDPNHVAAIKKRLAALGAGRRIGISWHTANKESGSVRSIQLDQLLPLLKIPGCHFVSLQHHVPAAEIEAFCAKNHCRITVDAVLDPVEDTEGLVALTASMDEVITVDNSNAHLAGALGVPTTLLLPKGCDFRWPVLKGGADTLWYSSVTLERQEQPMDWQPAIQRVEKRIQRRLSA
jgi:hypothetical protein